MKSVPETHTRHKQFRGGLSGDFIIRLADQESFTNLLSCHGSYLIDNGHERRMDGKLSVPRNVLQRNIFSVWRHSKVSSGLIKNRCCPTIPVLRPWPPIRTEQPSEILHWLDSFKWRNITICSGLSIEAFHYTNDQQRTLCILFASLDDAKIAVSMDANVITSRWGTTFNIQVWNLFKKMVVSSIVTALDVHQLSYQKTTGEIEIWKLKLSSSCSCVYIAILSPLSTSYFVYSLFC